MKQNTNIANTHDSRRIFTPLCARKPVTWEECPRIRHSEMPESQRALIRNLPVIGTNATTPMEDFLGENPPLECMVLVTGGYLYYVNAEGYRYARYALRILG